MCGASHRSRVSGLILTQSEDWRATVKACRDQYIFFIFVVLMAYGGHVPEQQEDGGDRGSTLPAVQQKKTEQSSVSCLMGFGSLEDKDKALYGPFEKLIFSVFECWRSSKIQKKKIRMEEGGKGALPAKFQPDYKRSPPFPLFPTFFLFTHA